MDIEFVCEHCGKTLRVQDYLAGQSIACYHCQQPVVIPREGEVSDITFQCLGCGTEFRVPASRGGSRSKCPKCGAVLVVPDAGGPTPPPAIPVSREPAQYADEPVYEEALPTPPPPRARPRAAARRLPQTGAPQQAEADEDQLVQPPKRGVSAGWIVFWVGVALVVVVVVGVVVTKTGQQEARVRYARMDAHVKYTEGLDIFEVTNQDAVTWSNVTLAIETPFGDYVHQLGTLAPNQKASVDAKKFLNKNGAPFDSLKMTGSRFIVRGHLPSGREGRFVLTWGGGGRRVQP